MIRFAFKSTTLEGLPWWSSGLDSALPTQGAWVRSLIGELRSCMPNGRAKKKKLSTKKSATTLATVCQADETQVGRLVRTFWNKPGERL